MSDHESVAEVSHVAEEGGGESFSFLFDTIGPIVDPVFSPLTVLPPYAVILIVSVILTFVTIAINRIVLDRDMMKKLKDEMEDIRERLNSAQKTGNTDEQGKLFKELMEASNKNMKMAMRGTLISITLIILVFYPWLGYTYGVSEEVVKLPFPMPIPSFEPLGIAMQDTTGWLVWYVMTAFVFSMVIRKLLGIEVA